MIDDRDPLIGTILAGRYRVEAPIGQGGAGSVYRAVQLQLEREVAIKVVRQDLEGRNREELEARFYREAALAGRLSHPNVVHTIDYGTTEDGLQFVVMELLRGRTLKSAMVDGALPADEAARIGAAVARGLHHAHSKGMVHRDVKSSNVFMVLDDEGVEHPKLLDFGLVKSVQAELDVTQTPTYLGTPLYMSPEQARGEASVDARSDIYALGCLLYRMICGEMPFRADSPMATALLHVTEPYPPMATQAPDVSVDPALEAMVERCLEKRPDDRWPDAATLAQALDGWRSAQHAAPVAEATGAPGKRGVLAAVMGAVGVLGLLGLGLGVLALVVAAGLIWWSVPSTSEVSAGLEELHIGEPVVEEAARDAGDAVADGSEVADTDLVPEPEELSGEDGGGGLDEGAIDAPVEPVAEPQPDAQPVRTVPAPAPKVVAPPRAAAPKAVPEPAQTPPPPSADAGTADGFEPVEVDGTTFTELSHVKRAVAFVNRASRDELLEAGVSHYVVDTVLDNRPYKSIQRFAFTRGIGPKTVAAVADHTR